MNNILHQNLFFVKEHIGMFKAANNYDIYSPDSQEIIMTCREEKLGFFTKLLRFTDYKRMTPFNVEIKTSSVEGRFKTRQVISYDKNSTFKKFGYLDSSYGTCLPNFFVSYEREYSIINDVRISIDNKITYTNFLTKKKFEDSKIIVELKTSINKNLDDLVEMFPFQKIRFSKYCLAVENLN